MGTLGMYPVSDDGYRVNFDDIEMECAGCGAGKMITRECIERCVFSTATVPTCRCGSRDWLNISEPPAFLGPQPMLWPFEED